MDHLLEKAISEVKTKLEAARENNAQVPYKRRRDLSDDLYLRSGLNFESEDDQADIMFAIARDPELNDLFFSLPE